MEKTIHTENDAWEAFAKACGSSNHRAHDLFKIERQTGCWVFRWADRTNMPMGMAPWVVTDDGKAMRVGIPLSLKTVLAEIAENTENSEATAK